MLIISERINGLFTSVGKAIDARDSKFIQGLAVRQVEHGAQALDVNVGPGRDDGAAAMDIVPFRYIFLLVFPVTFTLKPFLASRGHSAEDAERMYLAWVKSCLLQMTLWSYPYIKDEDF